MDHKKAVPKQFAELRLIPGDSFSIESLANGKRYPVRLIGFVENESLIVSAPKIKGKLIQLPEGQFFRVRLIADTYACGFQTQVVSSRRLPYLYSHLSYPAKFDAVAIRRNSRVKLSVKTLISEAVAGSLHGKWPRSGQIVDLSSGGARVFCSQPLAATGSTIALEFETVVDGVRCRHNLLAEVRNIAEVDQGYHYGVQFAEVTDQQRVYISGFMYEQRLGQGEACRVAYSAR